MMQLMRSRAGYSIHNRPPYLGQPQSSSSLSSSAYDRELGTAAPKPRKTLHQPLNGLGVPHVLGTNMILRMCGMGEAPRIAI